MLKNSKIKSFQSGFRNGKFCGPFNLKHDRENTLLKTTKK